jgi:ATP-binding protein involved in chromosome partitioning
MATFVCPHCGTDSQTFGHGGARHEAETLGVPFLGEVPLHMAIRETSDAGRPVTVVDPDGPQARAFKVIAAQVWATVSGGRAGRRRPADRVRVAGGERRRHGSSPCRGGRWQARSA